MYTNGDIGKEWVWFFLATFRFAINKFRVPRVLIFLIIQKCSSNFFVVTLLELLVKFRTTAIVLQASISVKGRIAHLSESCSKFFCCFIFQCFVLFTAVASVIPAFGYVEVLVALAIPNQICILDLTFSLVFSVEIDAVSAIKIAVNSIQQPAITLIVIEKS